MLEKEAINIIELEHTNHIDDDRGISKCEIPHMTDDLKYNEFFEKLMLKNVPCMITCASFHDWKSRKEWVVDNKPNFEYLKSTFGSVLVPVSDCGVKYYNVHKKSDITLEDYLIYWEKYMKKSCYGMPCLYLKDWHFTRDFPEEFIYRVPQYFSSDWLNEYYTARTDIKDDYRFVYMGPKGSWTPLHADVFTSFSWSINVCGQKRWLLFPPGEERCLRDNFGHLTYDATSDELKDEKQYPQYRELHNCIEVIQGVGEAIFVPSGWHHQVWNLEDTISINHNWINGCNIGLMWNSLQRELVAVRKEVEDCREMEGWEKQCQLMLKAIFGIDYQEFYTFLLFIAKRRLESLETGKHVTLFGNWQLGKNHILFDLKQLREILSSFTKETHMPELDIFKNLEYSPEELIKEIDTFVNSSCN